MMESILLRFPVIGQEIFKQVDNPNLTKCKEVCHSWGYFLNNDRLVWLRIIQKYEKNKLEYKEDWKKVTTKVTCETLKSLAIATIVGIGYPKFGYPRVIPGPEPNFGYGLGWVCV